VLLPTLIPIATVAATVLAVIALNVWAKRNPSRDTTGLEAEWDRSIK
jgi:hypothetical protein